MLETLIDTYRKAAVTQHEKGKYFEELISCYLRNEATYRDLYEDVWSYGDWAQLHGLEGRTRALISSRRRKEPASITLFSVSSMQAITVFKNATSTASLQRRASVRFPPHYRQHL